MRAGALALTALLACGGEGPPTDLRGVYPAHLARPDALGVPVTSGCFVKATIVLVKSSGACAEGDWDPCKTLYYAQACVVPGGVELLLYTPGGALRAISKVPVSTGVIQGPLQGSGWDGDYWISATRVSLLSGGGKSPREEP